MVNHHLPHCMDGHFFGAYGYEVQVYSSYGQETHGFSYDSLILFADPLFSLTHQTPGIDPL